MAILAKEPLVTPPVNIPAVPFPIWWLSRLEVVAPSASLGADIGLKATFHAARRDEHQQGHFHPEGERVVEILNIWDLQHDDPAALILVDQITDALVRYGQRKGILT